MAHGFLSGILWGVVVGVPGVAIYSLTTELPPTMSFKPGIAGREATAPGGAFDAPIDAQTLEALDSGVTPEVTPAPEEREPDDDETDELLDKAGEELPETGAETGNAPAVQQ